MKKFITSIFLILALVTSGLVGFTPTASAINKSAVRCDFLGQYINPTATGNPCQPCPENNYCPLVSGTQIENCATKGYPASDCAETRVVFSTDKAIACPAGTSTKGFTFNTLQGTRITTEGDLFPVGQGATDISMCNAPEFTCTAPTPVLIKGVDGKAKCVPANTCSADQVPILKDGIPDCSVACKSNTIVGGKCYQNCAEGEYLEIIGTAVVCKKITVTPQNCPILGQIPTTPGNISTCACAAGQIVNTVVTPNKCETPVVPCKAPQTGNEPNCVNPSASPCPDNTFGYSQPKCTQCPENGTNTSPNNVDSSSCKINVTPVTPCPENTFGAGQPNCQQCPVNFTSPVGTKIASGCVEKPAQNNGGGDGFCGGGWAWLCGGIVLTAVDCFLTKFVCNKSGGSISAPTPKINPTSNPVNGPFQQTQYDIVRKSVNISSKCISSNQQLVAEVYAVPGSHKESNGNKFFWVQTETKVVKGKLQTTSLSTIRSMEGSEISALKCLMQRFATMNGVQLGSKEYMAKLKSIGVLHGLNTDKRSPGYKHECIDLTVLLSNLSNYGENDVQQSKYQYAVAVRGTKTPVNGVWYNSVQEVKNWINGNEQIAPQSPSNKEESIYNDNTNRNVAYGYDSEDNNNAYNSNEETDYTTTFLDIFKPIKASAQSTQDPIKEDNGELYASGAVESNDSSDEIEDGRETIEVIEELASNSNLGSTEDGNTGYITDDTVYQDNNYEIGYNPDTYKQDDSGYTPDNEYQDNNSGYPETDYLTANNPDSYQQENLGYTPDTNYETASNPSNDGYGDGYGNQEVAYNSNDEYNS
jgi:hypothetical protein